MRKALGILVPIFCVLFCVVLFFGVYSTLTSGKQFLYNLSQIEREDALVIVLSVFESHQAEISEYYYGVTPETIEALLDSYLADAGELTYFDKWAMGVAPTVKQTGRVIVPMAITILVISELYTASRAENEQRT